MQQSLQSQAINFESFREKLHDPSDKTVPMYEICIFIGFIPGSIKKGFENGIINSYEVTTEEQNNNLFWKLGHYLERKDYTINNTYDDFCILWFLHMFPEYLNKNNLPSSDQDKNERNLKIFCDQSNIDDYKMHNLLCKHNIFQSPLSNLTHGLVTDQQQQQSVYDLNKSIQEEMVLQNLQNRTVLQNKQILLQNLNKLF